MDVSGSRWSSGCESGWTGYLDDDDSSVPTNNIYNDHNDYHRCYGLDYCKDADDEVVAVEEDLSMVSDASSRPPRHFQEDGGETSFFTTVKSSKKSGDSKKRSSKKSLVGKEHKLISSSCNNNHLDDTASSTAMTYSKMYDYNHPSCNQASMDQYMSFPQGISENHYQESSSYNNNHYGFWHSSLPTDANSADPNHFRGGRWE